MRQEVRPAGGWGVGEGWTEGDWQGGAVFLQSSGNLLVTGLMDKTSYSHKWPWILLPPWLRRIPLGFPPSQCGLQWLVCSQVGKGSSLISRLIHIPSELGRIEVWMWRIIINTRAVSPLHRSSRTLHNYTADKSSNQTRPGRPWPKH